MTKSARTNIDRDQYNIGELGSLSAVGGGRIDIHGPIFFGGEQPTDDSEGTIEPAPGEPPYKGLGYFNVEDADIFFGREVLTAQLVRHISEHSFLAVIGASGRRKSSVTRAGMVPVLQDRKEIVDGIQPPPGSQDWSIYLVTLTERPLERLAAILTKQSESITATTTLIDDMWKDKRRLPLHVQRMMDGGSTQQRVLLVVDQFEEIFTLCRDPDERKTLCGECALCSRDRCSGSPGGVQWVPLHCGADFAGRYPNCTVYGELRSALEQYQKIIGPMDPDELRRAIISPLETNGWEYEPELIDQSVAERCGRRAKAFAPSLSCLARNLEATTGESIDVVV